MQGQSYDPRPCLVLNISIDGASLLCIAFSGFQNLTGGSGNDYFAFSGTGSIRGNLNGSSGLNTLDVSAYSSPATINLQTKKATYYSLSADRVSRLNLRGISFGPRSRSRSHLSMYGASSR